MGKNHHKVLTELNLTQTLNAFLHNKTKPSLMFTWASPAREKCLKHFFNTLQFFKEPKAAWAPAGYAPASKMPLPQPSLWGARVRLARCGKEFHRNRQFL